MSGFPLRNPEGDPKGGGHRVVEYAMDPQVLDGHPIQIVVWLQQDEGGRWLGGLQFSDLQTGAIRSTAEILRGGSEADVWLAVRSLKTHHFRDLYRSLDP